MTVCIPLKYFVHMPDIQEAKCFELTVQILHSSPLEPPRGRGGAKNSYRFAHIWTPPTFVSVHALVWFSFYQVTFNLNYFLPDFNPERYHRFLS